MSDTHSLDALIQALRRLPGVGIKSAQRMAFHLLQRDRPAAQALARALTEAVEAWGRTQGCTEFASDALIDNIASWHMHIALGFHEAERVVYFHKKL